MNWATLLSDLRADLKDTGNTPRWTDDVLYLYVSDAIRDYSRWFPLRVDRAELALTNGAYPLPSNFVRVIAVESPLERFLEQRVAGQGVWFFQRTPALTFYVDGGSLYLVGSPHEDGVFLTYHAMHGIPANAADTAYALTIPDADIELLRLYVKSKCYEQMRGRQAALDRFKLGSGERTDNPIAPEVDDLMKVYRAKIAERIPGGVIRLHRTGRAR